MSIHLPRLFGGSFYYAVPINGSTNLGVNYLHGLGHLGDRRQWFYDYSYIGDDYYYDKVIRYTRSYNDTDNDEVMRSLRVGFEKVFSGRTSLDIEVTASRTRGTYTDYYTRYEENIWVYPDSTRTEIETRLDDTRTDPLDKEVLEANLFLHRKCDRGSFSLRFSFLSGETVKEYLSEDVSTENDSIVRQSIYRAPKTAGWSGGLIGIGGSREL